MKALVTGGIRQNQQGSSLIGALFVILAMGVAGTGVMQLSASESGTSVDQIQSTQAFYAGQAAIERVKHRLEWGYNPVGQMALGASDTTISTDPFQRLATVVAYNDDAQVTQTINTDFSRDAIQFDMSSAALAGASVNSMKAVKSKLRAVHLVRMGVEVNEDPCVINDTLTPENDLSHCPQDDGGKLVSSIAMEGTQIYGNGIGTADSETLYDVMDYSFIADQAYNFDITWNENVLSGTVVTVTFHFADGSELQTRHQVIGDCIQQYYARNNGKVLIDPNHTLTLEVLGSAITYGAGGPEVNVKLWLGRIDHRNRLSATSLFGGQDVDGGETYTTSSSPALSYIVKAQATYGSAFSAMYDSTNTKQVKTLVDGDAAPSLAGFGGQAPVQSFLSPYLDAQGRLMLDPNQVIMLFELGTNMTQYPNSPAADFQDAVVLLTIDSTVSACQY